MHPDAVPKIESHSYYAKPKESGCTKLLEWDGALGVFYSPKSTTEWGLMYSMDEIEAVMILPNSVEESGLNTQ